MSDKTGKVPVNTEMEENLLEKLDIMCKADEHNRSQFIRKLIRWEWLRREKASALIDEEYRTSNREGKNSNEKSTSS